MARNGSGVYTPPAASYPAVSGTLIEATKFNAVIDDMSTALTESVAINGQTAMTGDLPMGAHKITGLANGTASTDAVAYGQVGTVATAGMVAASTKATPVDADLLPLADSAASFGLKNLTWANLKATLASTFAALAGATFTGLVTFGHMVKMATGANIASAATINLATATGNLVHITGTTATSAVTMTSGQHMRCIADGAWPLTYHATTNRINGGVSYTCSAGDTIDYFYDGTTVIGNITKKDGTSVGTAVVAPVRQTVLSGPVDTNGFAAFGGATGSTTVTASGTLVATAANGFSISGAVDQIGSIVNPSWTGLTASAYLYLDIAADGTCTTGSTTLIPNYRFGGADVVTNNQFTFNIQEMIGKVGNGAAATQTYRVYVGEVTASGTVSAITWYALRGRCRTASVTPLPAAGTKTSIIHNLGLTEVYDNVKVVGTCLSAEVGYAIGDRVPLDAHSNPAYVMPLSYHPLTGRNTADIVGGAGAANCWIVLSRSAAIGSCTSVDSTKWSYHILIERGW